MKPAPFIFSTLTLALLLANAGCSKADKGDADKPAAPTKADVADKTGVTMDVETQERIGLKTDLPTAAQWQPKIHAVGAVVDPLAFLAAVSDLESAHATADASRRESERTQKLADENNASARSLETAQATAVHDALAATSAQSSFTVAWGTALSARTNLTEFAQQWATNNSALVKLSLAVGTLLSMAPTTASVYVMDDETNPIAATLVDDLGVDSTSQAQALLFQTAKKIPRGAAVTAELDAAGTPVAGVVVPFSAVLRHEGLGWVYAQTGTNQFARVPIPLDHLMTNGWFIPADQPMTNAIVTTGAQTLLSTELGVSAGGDSD